MGPPEVEPLAGNAQYRALRRAIDSVFVQDVHTGSVTVTCFVNVWHAKASASATASLEMRPGHSAMMAADD